MTRAPTIEWQVCGVCNYDCSYCIQSKDARAGHPSEEDVERFLAFFEGLTAPWEIKMTGGEPFAFRGFIERIVPGLVARTPHLLSVLTNLSAPLRVLERFATLTRGRLGVVSASIHLEHTDAASFVEKAVAFRAMIDPAARLVINGVLVPGRLDRVEDARDALERAGLRFFPQVMKARGAAVAYEPDDDARVVRLTGVSPSPRRANVAPSYRGRTCWAGAEYFVLLQNGDGWSCRTSRRHGQGYLGNVLDGTFALRSGPLPCTYDICPCTVPANRGMIDGISSEDAT